MVHRVRYSPCAYALIALCTLLVSSGIPLHAQPPNAVRPGQPPGGKKPSGKPGENKDDKNAGDKKGKGDQPEPKVIRRDALDGKEADPDELKATVGEDGRVAFQFRNQPWIDLIQWLSDISDEPIDWQELPADKVNLVSPGRYTVDETRDLFNRHLLARGYTLLELDGGITVMKTEGINPGLVQRVEVRELEELQPHTFVRTMMDAGWLSAEKLAEELKPMISKNGRLTALTTTNRIEAMDAAVNLRQITELLQDERNESSRDALAPEFSLRYIAADEAKQMLEDFLGVKEKSNAPMTPQQIQMMQRMQQQNKGAPAKKEPEIAIVANMRQNSILIRASRDKIAMAREFIRRIDVPTDTAKTLEDIKSNVQAFRLVSLDAEKLMEIVSELNVLEPGTRIRPDKDNSAVVVSGSAVDRYIIKSLIEQLDGSGRKFEVLQLRRLDAAEVAESIQFLMGQEEEEDDSNSRRSYFYSYYSRGNDEKKESDQFRVAANSRYNQVLLWASETEMEQVRSLLVKLGELPPPGGNRQTYRVIQAAASEETYEYLQRLRQQWQSISDTELELPDISNFQSAKEEADNEDADEDDAEGESKASGDKTESSNDEGDGGKSDDEKSDDASPADNGVESTELTSSDWPSDPPAGEVAEYQLTAASNDDSTGSSEQGDQSSEQTLTADKETLPEIRSMEEFDRQFRSRIRDAAEQKTKDEAKEQSPVKISVDSQGNLVIRSKDTKALDQLEDLMLKIKPPQREYVVFKIEHARASWITIDLREYFEEEEEDDDDDDSFYRWYYGGGDDDEAATPAGLASGNKLKFVYNLETNTIVVSGASPSQLRTIRELIELWDVPEEVDEDDARYTKLVQVQYGRAEQIAETLKEAYRDLLSGNDKAFSNKKGGEEGEKNRKGEEGGGGGGGLKDSQSGQSGGGSYSFKGKLSFGVDGVGNTLLISAEGKKLLDLMVEMVDQLDQAARPGGEVEVLQLDGNMSSESIQSALRAFGLETPVTTGGEKSGGGDDADRGESRDRRERRDFSRRRGRD